METKLGSDVPAARKSPHYCYEIRRNHMKTLSSVAVGKASLFVSDVTLAQSVNMMNDGMWSGDRMWRSGGM